MAFLEYEPNRSLFHYTNDSGFQGILESKCLWLSDVQATNDPREIHLGREFLLEAFRVIRHNDFEGSRGFPLSILAGKISGYLSERRIFSASFCHDGDSLPMWREYGDNCQGISIGFRPRGIVDMPLRVQKIKYLPEVSAEGFANLIREILPDFSTNEDISSVISNVQVITPVISAVASAKHGSWAYEREIRLTHATDPKGNVYSINGTEIPSYEYPDGTPYLTEVLVRGNQGSEITYVELPFGKYVDGRHEPNRAIETIILGPQCPRSELEISEFATACGFKGFDVVSSGCLIR